MAAHRNRYGGLRATLPAEGGSFVEAHPQYEWCPAINRFLRWGVPPEEFWPAFNALFRTIGRLAI